MQALVKIGMKLINKKFFMILFFLVASFSLIGQDNFQNSKLISYVKKIYDKELNLFELCLKKEGLVGSAQIKSACSIEGLSKPYKILNNFKDPTIPVFLQGFKLPKSIKKPRLNYPQTAQKRGITGFAIVSFDIDKQGNTINHSISPPFSHEIFHNEALKAAKKLKYAPLTYESVPIEYPNYKHKFTFILETDAVDLGRYSRAANKISKLIRQEKFEAAERECISRIQKEPFFYYQLAVSQFKQDKFNDAANSAQNFLKLEASQNLSLPEYYYLANAVTLYAESLYRAKKFNELTQAEEILFKVSREKEAKPRILWANLFLGTAFIYEEKYLEAIYYLSLTKYYAEVDGLNQIGEYASSILSRLENAIS